MDKTIFNLKVHGFHIDRYGHVNNGRYLEFLEMARWDYIEKNMNPEIAEKMNWNFTVTQIDIRYRNAAYFNDQLKIETEVEGKENVRVHIRQKIYRESDSKLIVNAKVTFVFTSRLSGEPLRLIGKLQQYAETGTID